MASKFAPSASFLTSLRSSVDADKKLKLLDRILKEIELVEYFHTKCPEKLTDRDWNRLMRTTQVSERVSMLEYFALTQKREAADQIQKEEKQRLYNEKLATERAKYDAGGMGYGPDMYASLLNPFRNEKSINLICGTKQWKTRRIGDYPKVAVDCQFFQDMPVKDMSKMGAQVQMVINENEVIRRTPFHMEFLNLDTRKPQIAEVNRLFLMHLNQKYGHQRILPDVYSNMPYKVGDKQVLYVTKYARQFFDGPLPHDKTIIVPATMDNKRESIEYCKKMRFTPVYLPIRKYVKWQVGAFYLPLPNIMRVLNDVSLNGGDWEKAVEKNVAFRHKQTIEERREKLGARYDKKYQELQERKEVIRMVQEALDKENQKNPVSIMSTSPVQEHCKRRVAYYYDSSIGHYYYGQGHVMKPNRIKMAHHLILNYGLYRHMEIYRPFPAQYDDLTKFHTEDYINFLKQAQPDNLKTLNKQMVKFNVGEDCPVFDGLYEFCQLSSGGSLAAAVKLNKQKTDIAINWMGGLHHAKKAEASGFCYSNDIVLGILELLKYHKRVLYVDIDVHHGDGVEEAFYTTDRVMTVSFHKHGDFFPGTGDICDIGAGRGKYYAVNVPLKDGITDESYKFIFEPVMTQVMDTFQPSAVVLQCGADSLNGDRLGNFNLTLYGHGNCVTFFRKYNIPLMLLGGGGYTARNVARCWTYETSLAVNIPIDNKLPHNDFFEYYAPTFTLHIEESSIPNENPREMLDNHQRVVFENLKHVPACPSVQMQPIPPDAINVEEMEAVKMDTADPDERLPEAVGDKTVEHSGELYDNEKEGGDIKNEESYKPLKRSGESEDTEMADGSKKLKTEV